MIFGRTAVTDANGNTTGYTVKSYGYYTYDAWGNVTAHTATGSTPASTSLIYRNPLRYRGYIYDNETGFYYLQSRYYDPANHRFINADSFASTGQGFTGTNMFAYCNNNPVNCRDDAGNAAGGLITTTRICDGGCGISRDSLTVSEPAIRDVTDEINAALSRAVEDGRVYREHSYCSHFCVDCCIDSITIEAQRYMSFYNLVDHYAPWDIKRKDQWEETIGTEFPLSLIHI